MPQLGLSPFVWLAILAAPLLAAPGRAPGAEAANVGLVGHSDRPKGDGPTQGGRN